MKDKSFTFFFQGAQLALDSISSLGKKINVFVYDSENDSAAVEQLVNSNDLALMDIIIGSIFIKHQVGR